MKYLEQEGTVVYTAKDKKTSKSFPALEWLAATRDLQIVPTSPTGENRWCVTMAITAMSHGGKRKEKGTDDFIPCILEPDGDVKALRVGCIRYLAGGGFSAAALTG